MIKHLFARTAALGTAFLAVSCSPYVYKEEVNRFSDGVEQAVNLFEDQRQARHNKAVADLEKRILGAQWRLSVTVGCTDLLQQLDGAVNSGDFRPPLTDQVQACVIGRVKNETVSPEELRVDLTLPNLAALGTELKNYAKSLTEIVNAGDEHALRQSSANLRNRVAELLKAVETATSSETGLGTPIATLTGFLEEIGVAALNQMRYNALRTAVNQADPLIQRAAEVLGETFARWNLQRLRKAFRAMESAADAVRPQDDKQKYAAAKQALEQRYADFVLLVKGKGIGLFAAMATAHGKLKQALADPSDERQIAAVIKSVQTFYDSAKKARTALESLPGGEGS